MLSRVTAKNIRGVFLDIVYVTIYWFLYKAIEGFKA